MSYDVDVYGQSFNYTYNMRQFFIDFDVYPKDWHGKPRAEVAQSLRAGLARIAEQDLEELRADYDADNGWGDVPTAIAFLHHVLWACELEFSDVVEVS